MNILELPLLESATWLFFQSDASLADQEVVVTECSAMAIADDHQIHLPHFASLHTNYCWIQKTA